MTPFIHSNVARENLPLNRIRNWSLFLLFLVGSALPLQAQIRINEVLAFSNAPTIPGNTNTTDWIEIINISSETVDLSDWSLSDQPEQPRLWVFPPDTEIRPGERLIIVCADDLPMTLLGATPLSSGFSLSRNGDRVVLYVPPAQGGHIIDEVVFGPQAANLSLSRIPDGTGEWRLAQTTAGLPNSPITLGNPSQLRINEWLASRSDGPDSFEIFNTGSQPVALGGLGLTDNLKKKGKHVIAPLSFIGVGQFAYQSFVADNDLAAGPHHVAFTLDADGESLGLHESTGQAIDEVTFTKQITDVSQGRFPDGSANLQSFPGTVSMGRMNLIPITGVVINEVMSHADEPLEDSIELYNPTSESIDVSGWYLSDNLDRPKKYRIPAGTVAEPGKYVTFYKYQMQPQPGVLPGFSLNSAHGEDFFVFAANRSGELTGEFLKVTFSSAPNGVPYGRLMTSTGPQFPLLEYVTFGTPITASSNPLLLDEYRTGKGAPNADPVLGPVVITEIMYAPKVNPGTNDTELEYLELRSIVDRPLRLYDPDATTNHWKLEGEVTFEFPAGITLPPRATVLVLPFDPLTNLAARARFEAHYGTTIVSNDQVVAFGPFQGKLNNAGGTVLLYRPDIPQFWFDPDFGFIPYIEVDQVQYRPQAPWPTSAHAGGASLQRRIEKAYGNDPTNWIAAAASPGLLYRAQDALGIPPEASVTATLLRPSAGSSTELRLSSSRAQSVQWYWNGEALRSQTNSILSLSSLSVTASGWYWALVANEFGSTNVAVEIQVQQAPVITFGPSNRLASVGEPIILVAGAQGTPPLSYQWFVNQQPVTQGTNATLQISSDDASQVHQVYVTIQNTLGSASSSVATLRYTDLPTFVIQPSDKATFEGQPVTFSATATGAAPLTYQWFKNGQPIEGETDPTFQIPSTVLSDYGDYTVRVRNNQGEVTSLPAHLFVSSIPVIDIVPVQSVVKENQLYMEFALYRTGYLGLPSSVGFGLGGTARWNVDFQPLPAGLRITSGTVTTNFFVKLFNNDVLDGPRTFTIILTNRYYDHKFGSSSNATVTIIDDEDDVSPIPNLKPEPASLVVNHGETAEFRIPASSQPGLTYQWQLNGEDLPEQTTSSLKLKRVDYEAGGSYRVRISNGRDIVYTTLSELIIRPRIVSLTPSPGRAEIRFEGTRDKNFQVEGTRDFQTWFAVGTKLNDSGTSSLLHEGAPPDRCFYRIQQVP